MIKSKDKDIMSNLEKDGLDLPTVFPLLFFQR